MHKRTLRFAALLMLCNYQASAVKYHYDRRGAVSINYEYNKVQVLKK